MTHAMKKVNGRAVYRTQLMVRVTKSLHQRLKRSAAQKGQSASVYVRLALIDALQRDSAETLR
jgi:predicted HicB family RNase H-like nuclease